MKKVLTFTILVILAVLLTACGNASVTEEMADVPEPTETTIPLPDEILDTIWQWQELIVTDPQSKSMVADPANYTVFFNREGFSDVEADCNFLKGNYHLNGETLGFSVGAPEFQICVPESSSCTFLVLMGQVDSYRMEAGKLILPFGDGAGEMVFYSVAAMDIPPSDLEGDKPGGETPGEGAPGDDNSKKVIVCHKPDSKNPVTLQISKNAQQAHLNHGDVEGPCP